MPSITLQLDDDLKSEIEHFSWINWSAIAKEEVRKKEIFERYIKTGELRGDDWEFCKRIDWHPVDELPLKKEFVKKLGKARKEKPVRYKSVDEFFKRIK